MSTRIIARLDVKGPNVVKGIQLEGLRVLGNPAEFAKKYYIQGADELLYIDIVASLYDRNNLLEIVESVSSSDVFIPITVGGGIRSLEDIKMLLHAGADKVAINTAAVKNPKLISDAVNRFGSQCIVGSIEAKYKGNNKWEAYIENGRECTGLDVLDWAKELVKLGVGEVLITSVDRDGTKTGYDLDLIKLIKNNVCVPVIACGGAINEDNICNCIQETNCDGVGIASILHYNNTTIPKIKQKLLNSNISIRDTLNITKKVDISIKKKTISIIDYNVGNIKSIFSAFKSLGHDVKLINTKEEINNAELLILPGDGAFGYAMKELDKLDLIDAIKEFAKSGKSLLGICLGMQLLMSESEEFGNHKGLNLIPGKVIKFNFDNNLESNNIPIPQIGWNSLLQSQDMWKNTILSNIKEKDQVYFVHSYYVIPNDKTNILANTIYGSQEFCSVIKKNNIYGVQFHPEKSGVVGMNIIKQFCDL